MDFIPKTKLEEHLLSFAQKKQSKADFINHLVADNMVLLAAHAPESSSLKTLEEVDPLILEAKLDQVYLILLTSSNRSTYLTNYMETYPVALTVAVKDLFILIPDNIGIFINPGYECQQTIEPMLVMDVRNQLKKMKAEYLKTHPPTKEHHQHKSGHNHEALPHCHDADACGCHDPKKKSDGQT